MGQVARWLGVALLLLAPLVHAAGPIEPEAVESLPYTAVGEPPDTSADLRMQLAPGAAMLAVNDSRTIWLYRRDARRRFAVTPGVAPAQPHNGAAVSSLEGMAWDGDGTLYAWVRLYNGSRQAYAATRDGPRGPVLQTPEHWPDDDDPLAASYPIPDRDNADDIRASARHIVWRQNLGHGSMALLAARPGAPPRELVRGGWELEGFVFDAVGERVIYTAPDGVAVHPLTGAAASHIAGTRAGDHPYAFDAASRWLVLLRPQGACSPAAPAGRGAHVCLLRLPVTAP